MREDPWEDRVSALHRLLVVDETRMLKAEMLRQAGKEIGELVAEKNLAYGDSFYKAGEVLKILYPNGVTLDQYPDMLAVVRVIDKLFRIATDKKAFGESPWMDVAGYGILSVVRERLEETGGKVKED